MTQGTKPQTCITINDVFDVSPVARHTRVGLLDIMMPPLSSLDCEVHRMSPSHQSRYKCMGCIRLSSVTLLQCATLLELRDEFSFSLETQWDLISQTHVQRILLLLLFSFQMSTSWISFLELKLISHSLEFALTQTIKICPPPMQLVWLPWNFNFVHNPNTHPLYLYTPNIYKIHDS